MVVNDKRMKFKSLRWKKQNALDNLRGLDRAMASRDRHFLHHGRVHPHLVGFGDYRRRDPGPPGPKRGVTTEENQ